MEEITSQNQPVFEAGPGWGAKLKKNFVKIMLLLITAAVLIAGIIVFLNKRNRADMNIENQKIQEIQLNQEITGAVPKITIENTVNQEGRSENIYKAEAGQGEGITHLARKALKDYLNNNPGLAQGLKAEHKIYIEDYLKDIHGERFLKVGEEVEFSATVMASAIELAKQLSDNQLANLSQFVPLVSGL